MEKRNKAFARSPENTDGFPMAYRMPSWGYRLAAVLCLAAAAVWLFAGSINISVTGYAHLTKGYEAELLVPSTKINEVKPGQQVWIGSSSGVITGISKDLDTYEEVAALYGYSTEKLHLDPGYTYYYVYADITDEKNGYGSYTITTGTVTPFAYYFGGGKDD